jgi:hypothetical protein
MTNLPRPGKQFEIEARYEQVKNRSFDNNQLMKDVFGPLENWTLVLGPYQLVLLPLTGQWWYFDPVHETWEDTGQKAGEMEFFLQGDLLDGRAARAIPAPPVGQAALAPVTPRIEQAPAPPTPAATVRDLQLNTPTISAAMQQTWRLRLLTGPTTNACYSLGAQATLGRIQSNEIMLEDALASRQHAKIQRLGDSYVIRDLDSRNGTFLNGQRLQEPAVLSLNDEIMIGKTKLVVEVAE